MLSKSKIKLINSLSLKKHRDKRSLFLAEGLKLIVELAQTFECEFLIFTDSQKSETATISSKEKILVDEKVFSKISTQKSPQGMLAVFKKRASLPIKQKPYTSELCLVLDEIQDPGNLGTIVRTADWFGIQHIFCSPTTADIYGIKAVQSTMGALARVQLHYVDLEELLVKAKGTPIFGTFLEGENIYEAKLSTNGLITMGNEGKGISTKIEKHINRKLNIPNYPPQTISSESLNVAAATAVVCSEFRRRQAKI